MNQHVLLTLVLGLAVYWPSPCLSHGRLWDPPGRSTMWRRGYNTPPNYDDNQLFCGGFQHEVAEGYKCGVCGDPYDGPFENEAGGKYATGKITNTYKKGQRATFQIDLTAYHLGYFEFKICPTNDPKKRETQECFDQHVVSLADGSGTHFKAPSQNGMVNVDVILPSNLVCDFCVLQWRYHAGNSWGTDSNDHSCVGCGPQEEFYACADIKIVN
jgi:hypothetical protein